jgi:hypothetical protein
MFATERVTVSLGPSRTLATLLCAAHGLAAAVPWVVSLPPWLAALASAAILALGGVAVAQHALRRLPSSVVLVEWHTDGEGRIELRSGRTEPVRLGADATVASMAVVMNAVTAAGRSHGVVVTRDACDAAEFRRLKVFLRWQMRPETGIDERRAGPGNGP